MTTTPTPQQILSLPIIDAASGSGTTIGQYLFKILSTYWREEQDFRTTSPFGNSNWKGPIIKALIRSEYLDGVTDNGFLVSYAETQFDSLMDTVFSLLTNADYDSIDLPPAPKEHYLVEIDASGDILDYDPDAYTQEEAENHLKNTYFRPHQSDWRVVHIPKVS